jgi:hypothetical protein
MYGKEKTVRKELRIKESALNCAERLCKEQNRNFNNLIETLIFNACESGSIEDQIEKVKAFMKHSQDNWDTISKLGKDDS